MRIGSMITAATWFSCFWSRSRTLVASFHWATTVFSTVRAGMPWPTGSALGWRAGPSLALGGFTDTSTVSWPPW
jgi:hypothetical protein